MRRMTCGVVAVAALAAMGVGPTSGPASAHAAEPEVGSSHRFDTWTGYDVGRSPDAVASADFNGDGAPDVAYAKHSSSGNSMSVQMNSGDGTMRPASQYAATGVSNDIAAGDLDADGDQDLVVVSEGTSRTNTVIDLFLNNGRGKFSRSTATGGHGAQRVAVGDLTGDGKLDLAITNYSAVKAISVLPGKGNGAFQPETLYPVEGSATGVVAADLDGDAVLDLAVGAQDPNTYQVYLALLVNRGDGRFKAVRKVLLPDLVEFPVVAAADFDGDGRQDLAAAGWRSDKHIVLRNKGKLSFTQTTYSAGFTSTSLVARDVDGDGRPDLVSATLGSSSTGWVSYLRNLGKGALGQPVYIDAGPQPSDVDIADFDGNGRLDLAIANSGSTTGTIQPQRKDGSFPTAPIFLGVDGLLPLDSTSADFDGDGFPDMALSELDLYSSGADVVAIFRNDHKGTMNLTQTLSTGTNGHAKSVYASDLNGDGAADLLWTPETFSLGNYRLAVSLNDGHGAFGAVTTYELTSGGTGHVTTADVDNDGDQDAIVANDRGPSGVRIALNKGDGTFATDFAVPMGDFQTMAVGVDLNGDNVIDIAAVEPQVDGSSRALMVVFGKGDGKRYSKPMTYTVGNGPRELAVGDFNADGHPDLVTANEGGDDVSNFSVESTSVLINAGNGTFHSITTLPSDVVYRYFNEFAVAVGDVDGDGRPDISVAHPQGQNVGVYYGTGEGKFGPEIRYGVHSGLTDVNLADYDQDGQLDIGGPGYANDGNLFPTGGVSTLLNRG